MIDLFYQFGLCLFSGLAFMPLAGFFACEGCCFNCILLSDEFDRADSTALGGGWSEEVGDWSIASNLLSIGSTNALVVATATNPDGETTHIECIVRASNSGNKARIVLDRVDNNNYHFAEVHIQSGGYIRIYERAGGTNTQLTTSSVNLSAAADYTFTACITPSGHFHTSISGGAISVRISDEITVHGGSSFGLGTGDALTGTVTFNDFVASIVSDECEKCIACSFCQEGTIPEQMQLVISTGFTGGVLGGCTCNTDLPGTYILDYRGQVSPFSIANSCVWTYEFPTTTCTANYLHFYAFDAASDGFVASFHDLETDIGLTAIRWTENVSPLPFDCQLVSLGINTSGPTVGGLNPCGFSATPPTCTATAL